MKKILFYNIKDSGAKSPIILLLLAFLIASTLAVILSFLLSSDYKTTLKIFFTSAFYSKSLFLSMLELSAPLAICAIAVIVAFRAGHYNLGGEGQVYFGAFSAVVASYLLPNSNAYIAIAVAMLFGIMGGGLIALIPALGKLYKNADVLLTSILVSQGFIFVIDWLIGGPLRDKQSNLIAMPPIAHSLHRLFLPSTFTIAPSIALFLCVLASIYFERSPIGLAHEMYGRNKLFAQLQGFNIIAFSWLPIVIAGMLHGLAGSILVLSSNGVLVRGMSGGIGFTAIGVALVARLRPIAIPVSVIFFAWLDTAVRQASILSDLPPDAGMLIQAVVILVVSARPSFKFLQQKLKVAK